MRSLDRPRRRTLHGVVLVISLAVLGMLAPAGAQGAEPLPGPTAPAAAPDPIDAYAPYQGQTTCTPTAKPGTQYVMSMVLSHYGIGRSSAMSRACDVGGQSEHKEGRALDWGLNVDNPAEKAAGDHFVAWLTAVGPDGKVGYNARRLGVMYIIWNRQIWSNSSERATWREYTGASPHTDHVHISLSWAGANMRGSWWTGVALPEASATRSYVTQVYADLFGRSPDPGGLQTWTNALTAGTPRVAVANSITASAEFRGGLISGAYREFLGREPDGAGKASWLHAMSIGMTIQQMEGGFLASSEYYARSGGTDDAWVRQLYRHVLAREAGEAEVQGWTRNLAVGTSRTAVARGFLLSTERLTTVIDGYYVSMLGRRIDPTGRTSWVSAIQRGTRTEAVIGGIVASAEYYARAQQ